jgi:hypothetical protein
VEGDGAWDQIAAFELNRKPFLLLYKQNRATLVAPAHKRRGAAVVIAPIINGVKGPAIGAASQISGWEADWTQITTRGRLFNWPEHRFDGWMHYAEITSLSFM